MEIKTVQDVLNNLSVLFPNRTWQPEIHKCDWYSIETMNGTYFVQAAYLPKNPKPSDFQDYVEGSIEGDEEIEFLKDKYGFRMQMPGYMDSTDFNAYDTEIECVVDLLEESEQQLESWDYDYGDDELEVCASW